MKSDPEFDYAQLRCLLEDLLAKPVKDFPRIDHIIDQLAHLQLAIKDEHGYKGNNPNELV